MSTLNAAEQLAAAIARAELAEQARDSAYLAHNLTRQRLDAALQEIGRLQGKAHDLLRSLWADSSHSHEGGLCLDRGNEKAPETTPAARSQQGPGGKP